MLVHDSNKRCAAVPALAAPLAVGPILRRKSSPVEDAVARIKQLNALRRRTQCLLVPPRNPNEMHPPQLQDREQDPHPPRARGRVLRLACPACLQSSRRLQIHRCSHMHAEIRDVGCRMGIFVCGLIPAGSCWSTIGGYMVRIIRLRTGRCIGVHWKGAGRDGRCIFSSINGYLYTSSHTDIADVLNISLEYQRHTISPPALQSPFCRRTQQASTSENIPFICRMLKSRCEHKYLLWWWWQWDDERRSDRSGPLSISTEQYSGRDQRCTSAWA